MGPLPKRRHSRGRAGRRQKNHRQNLVTLVKCKDCGVMTMPHRECENCTKLLDKKAAPAA